MLIVRVLFLLETFPLLALSGLSALHHICSLTCAFEGEGEEEEDEEEEEEVEERCSLKASR